jgi:hypothetical protein
MVGVTRVTGRAVSSDELTETDYRDIFREIRERCSLREFSRYIGSAVSFAWWGSYERGEKALSQDRRNELRCAVGLPLLPPSVDQALARVDPDAVVWEIGDGPGQAARYDRVVLVADDAHEPLLLRLNGDLRVVESFDRAAEQIRHADDGERRRRRARSSIVIGAETWQRLNAARTEAGLGWEAFLAGLIAG